MKVKKLLILWLSLALILSTYVLAAPKKVKNDPSKELYIEVSCLWNLEYFNDHKVGMKLASDFLGVKTQTVGPAEWDIKAMVSEMERAIAKKPAGIVLFGADPALNPMVKKAMNAGIPVVTVDADQPDSGRLAFIGTGNYAAGLQGADILASMINKKGKVAIMSIPNQTNHQERIRGYKEGLAKYKEIQIVQIVDTGADAVKSAQVAAGVLEKYSDLAAIICTDSTGGAGASMAVKDANKAGAVKIMAMDRGAEILQAINDGVISASIVQQTCLMPYYAVVLMHNMKLGQYPVTSNNKAAKVTGSPVNIDTGTVIVDKSNVKFFMKKK